MRVNIYIASSLRGMRRQNGVVGVVIEAPTSKGPATFTQFGTVKEVTPNQAVLLGIKFALSRIKPECEVTFWLNNTYVAAAIEKGWLEGWKQNGWRNSKGEEIANFPEWEAVSKLLGSRVPKLWVEKDHEYRSWLENEVNKRAQKYAKT